MNTKRLLLPLIAIALLTVSFISVSAQAKDEVSISQSSAQEIIPESNPLEIRGGGLVGTFIGRSTADLGAGPVPYIFTETFHEDGTCDSNSSIDLVPPAASTARGQWKHLGGNRYAATLVGTIVNSVIDPTLAGTFKLRQLFTLNRRRDRITDLLTKVDVFDVNGNLLFSFETTLTRPATLVQIELPN